MRIACILVAILFLVSVALQFNDLEQYGTKFAFGWVVFYFAAAIITLLAGFKADPRWLYTVAAFSTLAAGIGRAFAIEWEKTVLFNESNPAGNESGGLLIVGLWLTFVAWRSWKA